MEQAINFGTLWVKNNFDKQEFIEILREYIMGEMEKEQHAKGDKELEDIAKLEGLTLDSVWSYVEDGVSDEIENIMNGDF